MTDFIIKSIIYRNCLWRKWKKTDRPNLPISWSTEKLTDNTGWFEDLPQLNKQYFTATVQIRVKTKPITNIKWPKIHDLLKAPLLWVPCCGLKEFNVRGICRYASRNLFKRMHLLCFFMCISLFIVYFIFVTIFIMYVCAFGLAQKRGLWNSYWHRNTIVKRHFKVLWWT